MLNDKARIPVIPLSYADRHLAVEKELVIDYETGKIYIISSDSKEVIFDITEIIKSEVSQSSGDNITVNIEGVGVVELGKLLNKLNKSDLTLTNSGTNNNTNTAIVTKSSLDANVNTIALKRGQLIYTTDTNQVYYDINDTVRLNIRDKCQLIATEDLRTNMLGPKPNTIYITKDTVLAYAYVGDKWISINTATIMSDYIGNFDRLIPTTLQLKNPANPLSDTLYAPRTLASQVYTEDGETIEERIKAIGKVSTSQTELIAEVDNQTVFQVTFPLEDYMESGNIMMMFIGSVWINPSRYTVSGDTITFVDPDDGVALGRTVSLLFIYNAPVPSDSHATRVIDGSYIMEGSIPLSRMQKYSNSINLNDCNSIATSKAVKELHDVVFQKIADVGGNMVIYVTSSGSGKTLIVNHENFKVVDMANIYLKLHDNIETDPVLKFNGTEYSIKTPLGTRILAGDYKRHETINLVYNAIDGCFYLNSGENYILDKTTGKYVATGGEMVIPIQIDTFDRTIHIFNVYQNNLLLIEDENFRFGENNTITLLDYTADPGDVFYFEVRKIVKKNF